MAQLVTNTGARAKDVWLDVCSTGDVVSHSMLGEGEEGGQAPVCEYPPCTWVLTRLTEHSIYTEIPEETKSS